MTSNELKQLQLGQTQTVINGTMAKVYRLDWLWKQCNEYCAMRSLDGIQKWVDKINAAYREIWAMCSDKEHEEAIKFRILHVPVNQGATKNQNAIVVNKAWERAYYWECHVRMLEQKKGLGTRAGQDMGAVILE